MAESFSYSFDSQLREVPDDPLAMRAACAVLASILRSDKLPPADEVQILGRIGPLYRMLGELELAEGYLRRAVELAASTGIKKALLTNRIRLAHVLQWRGRFPEADSLFVRCLTECEVDADLKPHLHTACQHYGQSLFDQGRYEEAAVQFKRALDLRQELGDRELIESSEFALRVTEEKRRELAGEVHS